MLKTKADVDRHVQILLRKVMSDNERNLRCFYIAQLYYKVQDFESAHHYVKMYLSVRSDSPSAHKILGQSLENMGYKEKSLAAYKKSLELEANQPELVLKMCQLLCDKDVTFDPAKAHYWSERASSLFPHSPIVFALKEKLLSTDSAKNFEDFESLFKSELKARPTDTIVRTKLLKLYLSNGRVDVAYNDAFETEFKPEPSHQISWYRCLNSICDAYQKSYPTECNWEFYLRWLSALDRLCSLCMSETIMQPCSLVESAEVAYNYDQVLYKGSQQTKAPEFYKEFINHLSAQLAFQLAVLLLKRAKKENSLWKEIKQVVCPLFLFASNGGISDGVWNFSLNDNYQKLLKLCSHHAQCRIVQAGHVLCSLAKEYQSEKMFFSKVVNFTLNDWRSQIFQKVFKYIENCSPGTSHLVMSNYYSEIPKRNLSSLNLRPSYSVPSFEITYMGSLHHLVWLGLQSLTNPASAVSCKLLPCFYTTFFDSLLFTINNLNNIGVETLNQLDVDSFLYAAVFCAGALIEDQKANGYYVVGSPDVLPPDIMPLLCTPDQAKWWTNACSINKVGVPYFSFKNEVYDIRYNVQRGIEVVRGGGLQLELLVSLARAFAIRSADSECEEERSKGCEARALHLWRVAIPQLERLRDKHPITDNALKFFEYPVKELSPNDANSLLEEGRFFIACYYMKTEQHENAIDAFKLLRTPQSLFNQALIYQKLAKEQVQSLRGEEITSEFRSRHIILATKARDSLYALRDMIKGDRSHPLHQKLKCKMVEIDDLLSRIEPENDVDDRDGYVSDTSLSFGSAGSPTGDATNNVHYSRSKHVLSSTPKKYYDVRHRSSTADIAELLTVHLNTSQLKTQQVILEQNRLVLERIENLKTEQRNQRSLIDDLLNKFNKLETEMKGSLTDIKKEIKRPDLYNMLEDEDYNDDMLHYPNIPYYPQRGVQGTNTVTYGAPVAPFFSPRVDPMYQNNMSFYNQAALPFPDGQQVSDFLRTMPPTQNNPPVTHKINMPVQNTITQNLSSSLTLGSQSNVNQNSPVTNLQTHNSQKLPTQVPQSSLHGPLNPQVRLYQGPTNVVITTSDTLPTGTPPTQPTLSVTIPPQHRLGNVSHNFQIAMPSNMKLVEKSPVAQEDQESDEVEHDSLQNFQPVIPLPAKVDVKTGEENEQVLFSSRAKLYRFVDKQWKERGIGILKILKDISGKCRILMRRDQVHKICANHFITGDMNLQRLPASEKAWVWFANDFADEKVQLEKLCAKFETVEEGKLFKASFDDVKLSSKDLFLSNSSENLDSAQVDSKSKDQASAISSSQQSKPSSSLPNYDFNITPKLNSKLFTNEDKKVQQPEQPAEPQVSQTSSTSGTVSVGGFTFLKPPKLILEDKTQVKVVEEKKSESPFATFSFTSGSSIEASTNLIQMSSKSSLKKPQNKVPEKQKHVMFLPGADLGAISKLEGNAVATTTPSKTVEGVVTPVFGSKFQMSSNVFNTNYAGSPRPNDELTLTGEFKPVVPLQLVDAKNVEKNKVDTNEKKKERVNCNCGEESCTVCKSQTTSCKADVSMSKQENKPDLSSIFKPKEGSWECEGCFVRNDANVLKCPACSTLKPGSSDNIFSVNKDINVISFGNSVNIKNNDKESEKKPTSSNWFKTDPPGSWECDTCLVRNTPEKTKCASCDSNKVKSAIPAKEGGPLWNSKFNFETSGFTFGAGSKEAPKFTIGSNNKYTFGAQPAEVTAVKQDVNSNAPSGTEFQFGISNSTQPGPKFAFVSQNFQFSMPPVNNTLNKSLNKTEDSASDNDENDEDNGDHITFQPAVPLPDEIKIITGEEDEDVLYVHRAKLFRLDKATKEWKERGVGDIKILRHKVNGKVRFLMRREIVQKLCMNHYLTQDIKMELQNEKNWVWYAVDYSDGNAAVEIFTLRFKTPDIAKEFKAAVDKALEDFLQMKSNTDRSSDTTIKYELGDNIESGVVPANITTTKVEGTRNIPTSRSADDNDIEIVYENKVSLEDKEKALSLMLPPNFYSYQNAPPCSGCIGCEPDDETSSKTDKSDSPKTEQCPATKSEPNEALNTQASNIFGSAAASFNLNYSGFTFGQQSLTTPKSNIFSINPNVQWEGANSKVFGSQFGEQPNSDKKNADESGHDDSNEEVCDDHDPHFNPIVPLPKKIELKTGEEDEIIVFSERARLYKLDNNTKEWKERGVGEMKLLKHTVIKTYRLLMRREQVHKIVCNHLISSDFKLNPLSTSDRSWCWFAMNLAQDYEAPQLENLAAKFKNGDIANSFKMAVESAKADIHENTGNDSQSSFHSAEVTANEDEIKNQNL